MVKDDSMAPFIVSAGMGFHDTVLFKRWYTDKDILGKIVALKNPMQPGQIIFRRVIA